MPAGPRTAPSITVDGTPLRRQDLLLGCRVERGLGIIGRATLRFVDSEEALSRPKVFKIGAEIDIKEYDGAQLFSGLVTGVAVEHHAYQPPELRVTADDRAYPLSLGTHIRTHLNKSAAVIAGELADSVGLGLAGGGTSPAHPYVLQAGGDLAFLDHLAARAGCVWWVDDKTMRFEPLGHSNATVAIRLGQELEGFSVHASALTPQQVEVVGIQPQWTPEAIDERATRQATVESELVRDARTTNVTGQTVDLVRDASPQDAGEAIGLAKARHARNQSEAVVARGHGPVDGRLKPSVTVDVSGVGTASGRYLVTEVEHVYDQSGFVTRFTAGPPRPTGLVDLLTERPDDGHRIDGVLLAVVTAISAPEIEGRVKVQYTTMQGVVESPWAKVISPGAGKKSGLQFLPEVGDLVLVAFEQGDTRRPVVLGGVLGPDHHPSVSSEKKNPAIPPLKAESADTVTYRRMTSRLGHYVELADGTKPTEKHILLITHDGKASVRIGEDRIDVTTDGLPIALDNGKGAKLELAANGDVTLDAQTFTVNTKKGIKLTQQGGTEVELAPGALKAKGTTVEVKATGPGSIEAGVLSLKGSTAVNIN